MITTGNLLILLNKIDLVPPAERQSQIEKVRQRIHRALEGTRYAPALKRGEIDMIPFSAKPQDRSPPYAPISFFCCIFLIFLFNISFRFSLLISLQQSLFLSILYHPVA